MFMLVTNTLFQLIKNRLIRNTVELNPRSFHIKVNSHGQEYALYELEPVSLTIQSEPSQEYQLKSHHLSFYAIVDTINPQFNEYHYTAYFIDTLGIDYQLHVYFNAKDQIVSVMFSSMNSNGNLETLKISSNQKNIFSQLAIDQCHNTIRTLRKEHQHAIETCETLYNKQEEELSLVSKNMQANLDAYQILLKCLLENLSILSGIYPKYLQQNKLINHINNMLSSENKLQLLLLDDTEEDHEALELNHECKEEIKSPPKKSVSPFINHAKSMLNDINKNAEKSEKLKRFLTFHSCISDILTMTEDDNYFCSPFHLAQINRLLSARSEEGSLILSQLLLSKADSEFNLAESLKEYVSLVQNKFITLALKTGNGKILDFVLTHGNVPINTFSINDVPPVLYCYLTHSDKSSKVECLTILIKHNASLFVTTENGLSVAHHLVVNSQHPLYGALINNAGKTLSQASFYKTLCDQAYKKLLLLPERDSSRIAILQAIENFSFHIEDLNSLTLHNNANFIVKERENTRSLFTKRVDHTSSILMHSEVKGKLHELQILQNEFIHLFPPHHAHIGNELNKNVNKFIQELPFRVNLPVDKLLNYTLEVCNDMIKLMKLKIALLSTQIEIKKCHGRFARKLNVHITNIQNEMMPLLKTYQDIFQECDRGALKKMGIPLLLHSLSSSTKKIISCLDKMQCLSEAISSAKSDEEVNKLPSPCDMKNLAEELISLTDNSMSLFDSLIQPDAASKQESSLLPTVTILSSDDDDDLDKSKKLMVKK